MKKLTIPASPEDFTQEHIDFVMINVAGCKKVTKKPQFTEIEFWKLPDGKLITCKIVNPFTNMNDCKLLDKFLIERGWSLTVWYYYCKSEKCFYCSVYVHDKDAKIISHKCGFYPEEFARAVAIWKAFWKVGNGK